MFRSVNKASFRRQQNDKDTSQGLSSPDLSELCKGSGVIQGRSLKVISDTGQEVKLPSPVNGWRTKVKRQIRLKGKPTKKTNQHKKPKKKGLTKRSLGDIPSQESETDQLESRKAFVIWTYLSLEEKQTIVKETLTEADLKQAQDYFNIQRKGYYLPPIHHQTWSHEEIPSRTIQAHKTYTTRKGALLLYAEDLALSYPSQNSHRRPRKKALEAEDSNYLSTMKDLRSAILSYGGKEQSENVFMGFSNSKMNSFNSPRTVRPGFSAKRYLANWSKSWDDSILNYLRSEGHLWDKNLFESNSVLPSTYRRINDDMSQAPAPYRVTRNMLVSPGDIVSYEYYRIRPDDIDYGSGEAPGTSHQPRPPKVTPESNITRPGMIAAIARDGSQKPHPVIYAQLDPEEQQMVLQNLILQSAAHHSQDKVQDDPQGSKVMPLDMGEAIVHLVNENSRNILSGGNPFKIREATIEEDYSGSTPSESSWPDVVETLPYTEIAPHLSSSSAVPTLPPINIPSQQSVDADGISHQQTLEREDIKFPDINQGTSLSGMRIQPSTESFKERIKSGLDGEISTRDGDVDIGDVDDVKSKKDSVSSKLQKTGSKHSVMSNERKESGSVLSMSSQLSQSFENLSEANEQLIRLKGGVVPKNRTESMRSYKGRKSRVSVDSQRDGDVLLGGEDHFSVIGSVISATNEQHISDAENIGEDGDNFAETKGDEKQVTQDVESRQDGKIEVGQGEEMIKIPVGDVVSSAKSSESPTLKKEEVEKGKVEEGEVEGKQAEEKKTDEGAGEKGTKEEDTNQKGMKERVDKRQVERMHAKAKQGDEVNDSDIQRKRAIDGEDGLDQAEDTKEEDMEDKDGASHRPKNSPASPHPPEENNNSNDQKGGASVPLSSEMERHDNSEGKEEESRAEDLTAKESGHHVREMLPSSADHNREMLPSSADHNTDDDQNQQLPTASIGSDLIQEAEVSERSFPKSKKRLSMPSTPQAQAKQAEGGLSVSEFFTTYSYLPRKDSEGSSRSSRYGSLSFSLVSDRDDTEIGSIAQDSVTSDEWPEGGLETDGEALPQDDEPGTVNAPWKDGDALSKPGEELDGKEDVVDGSRGTGASRLQDEFADGDAPSVGTASTADDALMGKQTEGRNASSEKSDELSRSRQSSSSRTSLLMDQLEEEVAAIAEAVLQRPRSGRDLAEDAQLAAALWRERLGQLLQARPPPDDTRSVIVRRRKNSMDGSSVASSDIGQWDGADLLTGVERKSRRNRRVSSAQAAVDLFDPSLDSEVSLDSQMKAIVSLSEDEDNQSIPIAPSVQNRGLSRASVSDRHKIPSVQSGRISSKSLLGPAGDGVPLVPTPPVSSSPTLHRHSPGSGKSPSAVRRSGGSSQGRSLMGGDGDRPGSGQSKHSRSKSATSILEKETILNEEMNKKDITNEGPVGRSETEIQLASQSRENLDQTTSSGSAKSEVGKKEPEERDTLDSKEPQSIGPAAGLAVEKDLSSTVDSEGGKPSSRQDPLKLDVTHFGVADKPKEQRRASESKEDSELERIVADIDLLSKTPGTASTKKSKGSKSSKSQKSDKSSKKSGKSQKSEKSDKDEDKAKEFIVTMPHDDKEDYLAYKPVEEPETKPKQETGKVNPVVPKPPKKPKKEKAKKDKPKKSKKKKVEPATEEKKPKDTPSTEEPEKKGEDNVIKAEDSEKVNKDAPEVGGEAENVEEDEEDLVSVKAESPEFIIIHEEFSSDSEPEEEEQPVEVELPSVDDSQEEGPAMSEIGTEYTEDSSHHGPGSLSRSQARAAKRAAETDRKKKEIEKKRREKEEARRKSLEEQERKERIKLEFEEERRRKAEQMRLKQEADEEAKRRAEQSQQERERQALLAAERERKQQEEYKKKLEALAKKKKEEDKLRQEMEELKRKEEEERRKEEEEMLAKMAEEERLEYEKRKREEELIAHIKAEEERMRREIEAKLAQEEAERLAIEMAKRQKELEIRLNFNRELNSEANIFAHSQDVTRAFTWSYFELLEYLGIPIPENLRERYLKGQLVPQNHQGGHGEPSE
ncbi:uncharacterized protein [Apostichopus japonicus]|uniref:uncharacterized protein isoform X3 n=1 Tax=Stichopus japonicus TaxID=307972 RepID=UPI003AB8F0F9